MLSNNPKLNFSYLTIIHILHLRYCSKIMGHILKTKQKSNHVFFHETTQIITMKTKMKRKIDYIGAAKIDQVQTWTQIQEIKKCLCIYFFFYLAFFSRTFTNHRTAGEAEGISLTPHYHFHPLHRHLDISRVSRWWYLYVVSNT